MYNEVMNELVKKETYLHKQLNDIENKAEKIRDKCLLELMGDDYGITYSYLEKYINNIYMDSSIDNLENQLSNLLHSTLKDIRSSSTEVPDALYDDKYPLRLYPSGFGYHRWNYTYGIHHSEYKDIILKHGDKIVDTVWKENKKGMLNIYIDELKNWQTYSSNSLEDQTSGRTVNLPNRSGVLKFSNKPVGYLGISMTNNHRYYSNSGLIIAKSYYGSDRYVKISNLDDLNVWEIYVCSQFIDDFKKLLPEKTLDSISKISDNNQKVLDRIKERLIPYLAMEQI